MQGLYGCSGEEKLYLITSSSAEKTSESRDLRVRGVYASYG